MEPVTRAEFEALRAELVNLKLSRAEKALRAMRRNRRVIIIVSLIAILIPTALYAISITKSYTFTAGNPTIAAEVNANFDQLFTKVNDLAAYHPPVGTILAWHKSLAGTPSLPGTGEWVECNGQTLADAQSPYNGGVIPNLNGNAGGADSPGQTAKVAMFLRGGLTSGIGQQDAFQGHWHYGPSRYGASPWNDGALQSVDASGTIILSGNPISDGTNGTPRTASETRPVNMSVVWIIKVK